MKLEKFSLTPFWFFKESFKLPPAPPPPYNYFGNFIVHSEKEQGDRKL